MELGNIMFGNSRGEYKLDRRYQDWFCEFLESQGFDSRGYTEDNGRYDKTVKGYVVGKFIVRPYYWGACDCGYDELVGEWERKHKHSDDCYQSIVKKDLMENHGFIRTQWGGVDNPKLSYGQKQDIKHDVYQKWCNHFSLSYPAGSAVHCTCNYVIDYREFVDTHDHKQDCPIILSNFVNTKTGFEIQWYKYPLRDSYTNVEVKSFNHFIELVSG